MSVLVLLNAKAGTLNTGAVEDPSTLVERAFREAGRPAEVRLVEPDEMSAQLDEAARSEYEIIIVGGGDGTFSHALARLADSGKVLGLLPLGTVNLMARDMYSNLDNFAATVEALAYGEVRQIDLASINGRPFHTLCGLGYFSRVAREREQTRFDFPGGRILSVLASIWKSITRSGRVRLDIIADGRRLSTEAYAILVTSNRIGNDWRRTRLDEGVLELHLMRKSHLVDRAKAGIELLSRQWREGDSIETIEARHIEISGRPRIWVAVDGELHREDMPLVFDIAPSSIKALMPRQTEPSAP